jgi:hypothetical protein
MRLRLSQKLRYQSVEEHLADLMLDFMNIIMILSILLKPDLVYKHILRIVNHN